MKFTIADEQPVYSHSELHYKAGRENEEGERDPNMDICRSRTSGQHPREWDGLMDIRLVPTLVKLCICFSLQSGSVNDVDGMFLIDTDVS
ncbi:hypothetical protein GD416_22690 [Burkholderia sp. BE24]|uniref:hypothetical protein n=1 Tax=unclassified Burkholderia TaxID=2613784 RepID=UPI00117D2487|nr:MULTISPECIES: hypothetical protein [unclassified Burkholderia]MPV59150.1 hypothetical protein [Burkholderia sp. BE24]